MDKMKCGFAQNVITPRGEGIFQDGYGFRISPAEGVHDDLYVKAAVFGTDAGLSFGILVLDVCGMNPRIYEMLTDYIQEMTGLDREHVALCATHTHAGPAGGVLKGLPVSGDFWGHTAEICARTIREAAEGMCECSLGTAIADREMRSSHNRRNRPFIDRRIKAAVFTGQDGRTLGVIASACCHPVINTTMELSADYPQVLTRRALAEHGVPFLFLQGTCADINPRMPGDVSVADNLEKVGGELADGVMDAVEKSGESCEPAAFVRSAYRTAKIPMKPFAPLEDARKAFGEKLKAYAEKPWGVEKHIALHELEWQRDMLGKIKRGEEAEIRVPIQAFSVDGRLLFAFLPFETFANTGKKIEDILRAAGYEEKNIFVIGYANSVNGYLAPEEELPIGGYEITNAPLWFGLPECGELTEKTVIEAMKETALSL